MHASDRDLLVYEPGLFGEVGWSALTLLEGGTADVSADGFVLTSVGARFDVLGVDAGWVVRVGGLACEVTGLVDGDRLTVSRLRASAGASPMPLESGSGLSLAVSTFRPQIEIVHRQVLAMLGIGVGGVGEEAIVNGRDLIAVEALGALHLILSSASAVAGHGGGLWTRAESYRAMFGAERRRVAARLDLDGDGEADAVRRLNVVRLVRG